MSNLKTVQLEDFQNGGLIELKVIPNGVATDRPEPVDRHKPSWLRASVPTGPNYQRLKEMTQRLRLSTVCQEAMCPNIGECWGHGTMTIMVLGGICTRACKFCAVDTGNPKGWVDPLEPLHVAQAVAEMHLQYVVLTSVDRDDLPDGGASHFAEVVRQIKARDPEVKVETLTPDFQGNLSHVEAVLAGGQEVFANNLETVRRLTPKVRDPRAGYDQTLKVLGYAKKVRPEVLTKSSLMLGLGETEEEVRQAMRDLRAVGVDILTLGQYLRPTKHHLPVERYVTPEQFAEYGRWGYQEGFMEVFSGPLVRSSYRAEKVFYQAVEPGAEGR
ncbi:lipoyl synthase [Meiothermus granaticius]|uniref:Lipoyl synthase n=1 Tax=Meiothermus granaticius NBRC 107808 TaxID=1227551 RepID=A0A399F7E5_9DEIN|nr:lipoyl synthase [Meiothermus granaticius]MCL6526658.1 lipoyl synthase [Thermaceae bacterium]RIH92148.1 Lipoyl synthase [Meiothermus granaticius NBRC 107808]GEM86551.1 lipoyl synthase [Meiothermus granaticius NBRC 107808]